MNRIVEIRTIKALKELSSSSGGNLQGAPGTHTKPPFGKRDDIAKFNEEEKERAKLKEEEDLEEDEMREEIIIE